MPPVGSRHLEKKAISVSAVAADAATLAGLAIFSFGFWLAWQPLGFIVGGLALSALAILYGRSLAEVRRRS